MSYAKLYFDPANVEAGIRLVDVDGVDVSSSFGFTELYVGRDVSAHAPIVRARFFLVPPEEWSVSAPTMMSNDVRVVSKDEYDLVAGLGLLSLRLEMLPDKRVFLDVEFHAEHFLRMPQEA